MKNLKLFAFVLLIGTANSFANTSEPAVSQNQLRTQIVKYLQKSNVNFDYERDVEMCFTFSSDGRIVVTKLSSNDKKIKSIIRKNLNFQRFLQPGKSSKIYKITLKFEPS